MAGLIRHMLLGDLLLSFLHDEQVSNDGGRSIHTYRHIGQSESTRQGPKAIDANAWQRTKLSSVSVG
jgi:hypothetical protein